PLELSFVFAGESASTPVLIRQVEANLDARGREAFVRRSDSLGQQLEDAMLSGDFAQAASAIEDLERLLAALGPLETDAMKRVLAIAKSYGAAGKMSGAGGGDGCVLLSPTPEVQSDLLAGLRQRGFHAFALTVEAGLRGEARGEPELLQWIAAG
ncbi:MAG: phosphomevalonate kinase, partial [Myxococcaceae bacterium]